MLFVVVLTLRHTPVPILSNLPIPILQKILVPVKKNLLVPFTSQAPDNNWAEPWQNACEETVIVMVDNFYRGTSLTKEIAIAEISKILSSKEQSFGQSKNESLETMLAMINAGQLNWQARVVTNPTLKALQGEIVKDRPVIVPVDARLLTNPYYANITPEYHVIVVSGYDSTEKKFIVQDPGTDKGANFTYGYDELMNAMHDYVTPDISQGRKAAIFTTPTK